MHPVVKDSSCVQQSSMSAAVCIIGRVLGSERSSGSCLQRVAGRISRPVLQILWCYQYAGVMPSTSTARQCQSNITTECEQQLGIDDKSTWAVSMSCSRGS